MRRFFMAPILESPMNNKRWFKKSLMAGGALTCAAGLAMLWSTDWLDSLGGSASGERLDRMRSSDQWDSTKEIFVNADHTTVMMPGTTFDTSRAWLTKPSDAF